MPASRFADLARRLMEASRAAGLQVPAFRSPPRRAGSVRTIRRLPGGAVVSVVLRGRTPAEVARDMVEGIVAANRLEGEAAVRVRTALCAAIALPAPGGDAPGAGGAGASEGADRPAAGRVVAA